MSSTSSPRASAARPSSRSSRTCAVPAGTNLVLLRGIISGTPVSRQLATGRPLLTLDLSVRADDAPAESVPVCWFDPPRRAVQLRDGGEVCVVGRVRRRFFRAGGSTISRTEVVACSVVPVSAPAQVRDALAPLLESVAAFE